MVSLKDCQLLLSSENITRLQRVIPKELVRRREGGNRREEEGAEREKGKDLRKLIIYFFISTGEQVIIAASSLKHILFLVSFVCCSL